MVFSVCFVSAGRPDGDVEFVAESVYEEESRKAQVTASGAGERGGCAGTGKERDGRCSGEEGEQAASYGEASHGEWGCRPQKKERRSWDVDVLRVPEGDPR